VSGVNRQCPGARFTTPRAFDENPSSSLSSEHQRASRGERASGRSHWMGVAGSFTKDSQSASLLFPRQARPEFLSRPTHLYKAPQRDTVCPAFLECSLVVNGKSHIVVSTLLIEGTVNNVPAIILLDTGSREDIKVVREFLRHTSACITQDFCRLIRPRSWKPSRCSRILSWYLRTKTAQRLTSQQKGSRQSGSLSHFSVDRSATRRQSPSVPSFLASKTLVGSLESLASPTGFEPVLPP
jgi:hypothetical protein